MSVPDREADENIVFTGEMLSYSTLTIFLLNPVVLP